MTLGELIDAIKSDHIAGEEALRTLCIFSAAAANPRLREKLASARSFAEIYYSQRGAEKFGGLANVKRMVLADLTLARRFMT